MVTPVIKSSLSEKIYYIENGKIMYRNNNLRVNRNTEDNSLFLKINNKYKYKNRIDKGSFEYRIHSLNNYELNMYCFSFKCNKSLFVHLERNKVLE